MDRLTYGASITDDLTVKGVDGQTCWRVCEDAQNCDHCPIQTAFEHLASYEDTGLTPAEINQMKAEYSDTFQAHLNQLLDIKDKQIEQLKADNARLHNIVDSGMK